MRRRKRKHIRKLKKQIKIIIIELFGVMFCLSFGYAAFSTNINLSAKGNVKVVLKTVCFHTELLENNNFDSGLDNWNIAVCDNASVTLDTEKKYNNKNTVRVYEKSNDGGCGCWNGFGQTVKRKFDMSKTYELHADIYRDADSTYGDLNNILRVYAGIGSGDGGSANWIKLKGSNTASINITTNNLPNTSWKQFIDYGNTPTRYDLPYDYIHYFNIDYHACYVRESPSNVWVSSPHFHEIEEKMLEKARS